MQLLAHLNLRSHFRNTSVIHELQNIHPDAWRGHSGYVVLPEEDERLHLIIHILNQSGYSVKPNAIPPMAETAHQYDLWYSREYNHSDLSSCSYFQIDAFKSPPAVGGHNGLVSWPYWHTEAIANEDFVEGDTDRLCCPDRVRHMLEAAGLRNIGFRETVPEPDPDGPPVTWDTYGPPWWELTTDVVMPPMSPSMILYDGYWKRVEAGDQRAMFVYDPVDPRIGKPELHYRAADLAAIEPFDIAKTFEKYRAVIVSKRFYDVCMSLGLKAKWTPVRVEH